MDGQASRKLTANETPGAPFGMRLLLQIRLAIKNLHRMKTIQPRFTASKRIEN